MSRISVWLSRLTSQYIERAVDISGVDDISNFADIAIANEMLKVFESNWEHSGDIEALNLLNERTR